MPNVISNGHSGFERGAWDRPPYGRSIVLSLQLEHDPGTEFLRGKFVEVIVCERPATLHGLRERSTAAPRNWPTSAHSRTYLKFVLFALCATLYLLPFMRPLWKATDEGTIVYGAVRVVHGQVFGRDFFEVMGPGSFYWLAAFFKIFGVTFLAERICLFVTSLGTGLSIYFLTRRLCGKYQILPAILMVGVSFSTIWPMVNHHTDSNFFALLAVVCVVLWQDKGSSFLLVAGGALAAVTTCILQPKGILLLLGFLIWLGIEYWRHSAPLSAPSIMLTSYLGVIAAILVYFWAQGALRDLLYMNLIWPWQNYGVVNTVPYATGISQFWTHWTLPIHGIRWLLPVGLVLITPFALVALLPALVPALGLGFGKENLKPQILLYWFCAWALWLSEFHRRDIAHLASGSPLLIILCVYFLTRYEGRPADLVLQFLALSAGALATVNLFIVLCARPVQTRVGEVAMFKADPVLTFLDGHTKPGEEIFSYPYCPMYYFLSGTTNPTRYSLLIYNYNTPSQFDEVIRVLDRHKVKYVVWDASFQEKAAATFFTATMYRPAGGFLMEPYLKSHYKVVQDIDGIRIMERKANDNAASQ